VKRGFSWLFPYVTGIPGGNWFAGNRIPAKIGRPKGIHWDGARMGAKEPTVLILSASGPSITRYVDENGKDAGLAH
jgi:hypothetical protein